MFEKLKNKIFYKNQTFFIYIRLKMSIKIYNTFQYRKQILVSSHCGLNIKYIS